MAGLPIKAILDTPNIVKKIRIVENVYDDGSKGYQPERYARFFWTYNWYPFFGQPSRDPDYNILEFNSLEEANKFLSEIDKSYPPQIIATNYIYE